MLAWALTVEGRLPGIPPLLTSIQGADVEDEERCMAGGRLSHGFTPTSVVGVSIGLLLLVCKGA